MTSYNTLWRGPDGTFRICPPAKVTYADEVRRFAELTPAQRHEIGYNEARLVRDEPFISCVRKPDLIMDENHVLWEEIESVTVDEAARAAHEARTIRAERNRLLVETDWTQLADAPVNKAAWATCRQSLRDLPQQPGFPFAVTWPAMPQ